MNLKGRKGMCMKEKRKKQSKLDRLLEIPEEISSLEPRVTIMGFKKMVVENFKSVLEYQEFYIRLNTYVGILNINGFNLKLGEMTKEDITITGKIESIDFEESQSNEQ